VRPPPALRPAAWIFLLFLALDLAFLRWVWVHFSNWGFWDWDYQQSLLEVTRLSWLAYGEIPRWNPFLGGGASLAGESLNHAFGPSFLPVLALGTLAGTKLCLLLYALLAQLGMFLFARDQGVGREGAFLAALLFSVGGPYAQHLAHGHFEWIAIAWIPFVLLALHRNAGALDPRSVALGALCLAFVFLDGGPYQFVFLAPFLGAWVLLQGAATRSHRPVLALALIGILGAGIAAIKLAPVFETALRYPREVAENNFYGAPFRPGPLELLQHAFVSRQQEHRPDAWMPYFLNVGAYLGWAPLALAAYAMARSMRERWFQIAAALLFVWIMLGPTLPWTPWSWASRLPGFSMLRVPSRFNVHVVLLIALFAGLGLQLVLARFQAHPQRRWLGVLAVGTIALDLAWVNGRVFQVAFSVPPLAVEKKEDFRSYLRSPYLEVYRRHALYPTFGNWPSALFPAVLENRGVIANYRTTPFPSHAIPFEHPAYRGEAWFREEAARVERLVLTPNRVSVTTNGAAGTLVVNRNHDDGWKSVGAAPVTVSNEAGLIAVRLAPGERQVELAYRPRSFAIGAAVSLASLAVWLGLLFRRRPLPRVQAEPGSLSYPPGPERRP
jgi:hypothetical protein